MISHGTKRERRRLHRQRSLLLAAIALALAACSPSEPVQPEPSRPESPLHTVGNQEDVQAETAFGLALVGGGGRSNDAYRWLLEHGGGGDFVLLTTASYSDQEDERFFSDMQRLGKVDSITTLTVDSRVRADAPEVEDAIRRAELIFIDGGDQSEYYELWQDTRLQRGLEQVVRDRRVPLGGTSAGMAILSGLAYIPGHQGVTSTEALADPYQANMDAIRPGFVVIDFLADTISDTHWSERDRCGRTIAFLARIVQDGLAPVAEARAIACDESTAVCIDAQGRAVVFGSTRGDDYAYFITCRSLPDRCLPGRPLHWAAAVSAWKLKGTEGGVNGFDLAAWQGWGGTVHEVNVLEGVLSADIQTPR
jgi:cyanophycinase-like exopeptidase